MPAAPGQEGAAGPANESTSPPEGSKWQQGSDYDIIELPGKSKGAQAKAKAKGKGAGAMDREALLRGCVSLERRCFPKHEAMGDDLRDEADKHGAKLYIALSPCVGEGKDKPAVTIAGLLLLSKRLYGPSLWNWGDWWCVSKLVVAPQCRGRGVGGALLDVALKSGPPSRCYMLHVDPTREAAVSLYTSRGFVQTGPLLHEYYMKGRHAMLMTKTPPQPL